MKPLTALASVLDSAVFRAEPSGRIVEANPAFTQLMRCVTGDDWRLYVEQTDRALVDDYWSGIFSKTEETLAEPLRFNIGGAQARFQLRAQIITEDDAITGAVAIIEHEQSSATPRWTTDPGTGLPETEAVMGRFTEYIETGKSFAGAVVLLNEAQATDDTARKEAARQLLTTIRPTDLLTSSNDGRFVVCAAGIENEAAAEAMAQRMLNALAASELDVRIGLVLPDHDAAAATLLREAEAGAYNADSGAFGFASEEPGN